ncbi:MAG TPA: DUF2934 domain-containing protein [Myxococcaceae bacterium]|jgi:hypothetical protein
MPSKRNSNVADAHEGDRQTEPAAETRARVRPAPAPRPSRGASVIPAPRKAELGLHRVAYSARPMPTHEQIARRAYEIWLLSGCVSGRDTENWSQAERELSTGCATSDGSAAQQA